MWMHKLQLQSDSQAILVTAPRATAEAEAINVERTADNILQVLPSEVILSLPNANLADALGRLPSVTLERDEGEGNTCRSGEPSRVLRTRPSTVSTSPLRSLGSGRSNLTPYRPTSWSRFKSARRLQVANMDGDVTASGSR